MILAKKFRTLSRFAAVSMLLFAVGCSREEKPSLPVVPASRQEGVAFKRMLTERSAAQNRVARRLSEIESKMADIRKRVAKPEADPEWKSLCAAREACASEMKNEVQKTRAQARAALMQEVADKAAVREGRAVVAQTSEDKR